MSDEPIPVGSLAAYHELPSGAVTRRHTVLGAHSWSVPAERGGQVRIWAILLSGAVADYAVYVGVGDPDWVRANGDKIPFELAKLAFVEIEESRYRR